MEGYTQQQTQDTRLYIDEMARTSLLETIKWSKFIAIVGYIMLGFMVVFGLLMAFSSAAFLGDNNPYISSGGGSVKAMLAVMYLLIGLLYFFPTYYLFKFSTLTKQAMLNNNQILFNEALGYQRKMFRFIGILMIVTLCCYALMAVLLVVFVTAMAA